MNTRKQTLFQTVLARLSFGAVPIDGQYWFDPKDAVAARPARQVKTPDADWSPVSLSLSRPGSRS
jgi:hypothetical protein